MKLSPRFAWRRICPKRSKLAVCTVASVATFALLTSLLNSYERLRYPEQWKTKTKTVGVLGEGQRPDPASLELYDLGRPVPAGIKFVCISTDTSPAVRVCLLPSEEDVHALRELRTSGVLQPDVTSVLMGVLNSDPTSVFLDIGSNLGYFSLLAARMGHLVVSIEPDLNHVLRLHQAIELGGVLKGRILVLRNAVADVRVNGTVIKTGSGTRIVLETGKCQGSCPPVFKSVVLNDLAYLVRDLSLISANPYRQAERSPDRTILDRLQALSDARGGDTEEEPYNPWEGITGIKFHPSKVVVKVAARGFEHRIFDNPDVFFGRNLVTHIFMEWGMTTPSRPLLKETGVRPSDRDPGADKVEATIRFLSERGFRPYSTTRPRLGEALNPQEWHTWPHNIVWCHDSQTFFMAKMGIRNLLGW